MENERDTRHYVDGSTLRQRLARAMVTPDFTGQLFLAPAACLWERRKRVFVCTLRSTHTPERLELLMRFLLIRTECFRNENDIAAHFTQADSWTKPISYYWVICDDGKIVFISDKCIAFRRIA